MSAWFREGGVLRGEGLMNDEQCAVFVCVCQFMACSVYCLLNVWTEWPACMTGRRQNIFATLWDLFGLRRRQTPPPGPEVLTVSLGVLGVKETIWRHPKKKGCSVYAGFDPVPDGGGLAFAVAPGARAAPWPPPAWAGRGGREGVDDHLLGGLLQVVAVHLLEHSPGTLQLLQLQKVDSFSNYITQKIHIATSPKDVAMRAPCFRCDGTGLRCE